MGGWSDKDTAKYTDSSMKEVKYASHVAKDDAAKEGGWGVPKNRHGEDSEGGCFIATAAFGNYFDPQVKVFRNFRDIFLMGNIFGRFFIKIYYFVSPFIAGIIEKSEILKKLTRIALSPVAFFIKHLFLRRD